MYIYPECIPCIINMTVESCRKIIKDEGMLKHLFSEVMNLDAIKRPNWHISSPEIIKDIWLIIER